MLLTKLIKYLYLVTCENLDITRFKHNFVTILLFQIVSISYIYYIYLYLLLIYIKYICNIVTKIMKCLLYQGFTVLHNTLQTTLMLLTFYKT